MNDKTNIYEIVLDELQDQKKNSVSEDGLPCHLIAVKRER
jgi:hypothetical protein